MFYVRKVEISYLCQAIFSSMTYACEPMPDSFLIANVSFDFTKGQWALKPNSERKDICKEFWNYW
jgi:hypothetical protein